jgi:hypothetical protein
MDVNVIYLSSTDYSLLEEEEVSQLALGPQEVIFKKLVESGDHLKPLYICGHLDGTPVAHMMVDGGTTVNVMPYSTFRKPGRHHCELIKMNMIIMGIGGDGPIGPKCVASDGAHHGKQDDPHCIFHRGGAR